MRRTIMISVAMLAALALSGAAPAFAQPSPPCGEGAKAEPATRPTPTRGDSTAPGASGSSGWTGGTGGSQIGTSQAGATPASKTFQPETTRGLDLTEAPPAGKGC